MILLYVQVVTWVFETKKNSSLNGKVKVSLTESSEDEVEEILAKAT